MGFIGIPHRIIYEAKRFASGLGIVRAAIYKSDGNTAGPFNMTEMPAPFLGRYFFDFFTTVGDPVGEYMALIVAPDGSQTSKIFSLYVNPIPILLAIENSIAGINAGSPSSGSGVIGFVNFVNPNLGFVGLTVPSIGFVDAPNSSLGLMDLSNSTIGFVDETPPILGYLKNCV